MASLDIKIIDAAGARTEEATVPGDAAVAKIINKLVDMLELPQTGPDGELLSYRFHHKKTARQIDDAETLEDAGVQNGDVLRLVAELTAG